MTKYKELSAKDFYLVNLAARQLLKFIASRFSFLAFLIGGGIVANIAAAFLVRIIGFLVESAIIEIDLRRLDSFLESDKENFKEVINEVWKDIDRARKLERVLSDTEKNEYRKAIIDATVDFISVRDQLVDDGVSDDWKKGIFNS